MMEDKQALAMAGLVTAAHMLLHCRELFGDMALEPDTIRAMNNATIAIKDARKVLDKHNRERDFVRTRHVVPNAPEGARRAGNEDHGKAADCSGPNSAV